MNVSKISSHVVNKGATQHKAANKTSFKDTMSKMSFGEIKAKEQHLLTAKKEIISLSKSLKSGEITPKEANKRFVDHIILNSLAGRLSADDHTKLASFVADFFADDKEHMDSLIFSLNSISNGI